MSMLNLKFHHIGIPTKEKHIDEKYYEPLKFYHWGYETSEFGIEWMRFGEDCPLPEIVKTIPHLAFEVEDLHKAIEGRKVIIPPNSPSEGVLVAMIEENGAPVEFLQFEKTE
jgi:hypothetical protein